MADRWLADVPVITRTYMIGACLTTAACNLDLISPFSLYFSFKLVFFKYQVCQLLLCLVFLQHPHFYLLD